MRRGEGKMQRSLWFYDTPSMLTDSLFNCHKYFTRVDVELCKIKKNLRK